VVIWPKAESGKYLHLLAWQNRENQVLVICVMERDWLLPAGKAFCFTGRWSLAHHKSDFQLTTLFFVLQSAPLCFFPLGKFGRYIFDTFISHAKRLVFAVFD